MIIDVIKDISLSTNNTTQPITTPKTQNVKVNPDSVIISASNTMPLESKPTKVSEKSNIHTLKTAQDLYEKKGKTTKLSDNSGHCKFDGIYESYAGVPSRTKLINPEGLVLRHYTEKEETLGKIIESEYLIAGITEYCDTPSKRFKIKYPDMTGVFLTKPDVDPKSVGVAFSKYYVDITLPADTGLLELEPNILLVPGKFITPDWVVKMYNEKYKKGIPVPESDIPYMQYLDRNGICTETTKAFINIVSSGKID